MRLMTGSDEHLDAERGLNATLTGRLSPEDGLYWRRYSAGEPWHSFGYPGHDTTEDYSDAGGDQVLLRTLMTWRELDGDDRWTTRIRALIDGLDRIAVHTRYAYFPQTAVGGDFSYLKGGWPESAKEPIGPHEGGEGDIVSCKADNAGVGPLVQGHG